MKPEEKDAVCQLWIEIFGTQEGVGYNCPQGAYDFAEVVMAYEREQCAKVLEDNNLADSNAIWFVRARGEK